MVQCDKFDLNTGTLYKFGELTQVHGSVAIGSGNRRYYMNVCGPAIAKGCSSLAGVCLEDSDGSFLNIGKYSTAKLRVDSSTSVTLLYDQGDACQAGSGLSQSAITFKCDVHAFHETPKFVSLDTSQGCLYKFEWVTCHACPSGCAGEDVPATLQPPIAPNNNNNNNNNNNFQPLPALPTPNGSASSGHGARTFVIILLVAVVAGLALLVLRNPSRRDRIVQLFQRDTPIPRFQYTKLSTKSDGKGAFVDSDDDSDDDDPLSLKKDFMTAVNTK
jgi:hypothetical protein